MADTDRETEDELDARIETVRESLEHGGLVGKLGFNAELFGLLAQYTTLTVDEIVGVGG